MVYYYWYLLVNAWCCCQLCIWLCGRECHCSQRSASSSKDSWDFLGTPSYYPTLIFREPPLEGALLVELTRAPTRGVGRKKIQSRCPVATRVQRLWTFALDAPKSLGWAGVLGCQSMYSIDRSWWPSSEHLNFFLGFRRIWSVLSITNPHDKAVLKALCNFAAEKQGCQ